jgi:hypothetical protein
MSRLAGMRCTGHAGRGRRTGASAHIRPHDTDRMPAQTSDTGGGAGGHDDQDASTSPYDTVGVGVTSTVPARPPPPMTAPVRRRPIGSSGQPLQLPHSAEDQPQPNPI